MKFNRPTLVTLTAPTCSGKSTLLNALTDERDPIFTRIVSTTTRAPRAGEEHGVDYYFISEKESLNLEYDDKFAELVNFRGTRYGVTKKEMFEKINGDKAPIVILEPNGLAMYEKLCIENGWDIYRIFIYTQESVLLQRLIERSALDLCDALLVDGRAARTAAQKILSVHTDRVLSITGEERSWRQKFKWDLLLPGDDLPKALADLAMGVKWRNSLTEHTAA